MPIFFLSLMPIWVRIPCKNFIHKQVHHSIILFILLLTHIIILDAKILSPWYTLNGVTILIAMGRSFDTIMGVDYWCHAIHVDVMNYVIFGIQNSHCL